MALAVYCDKCGSGLEAPGGLAFSPPDNKNKAVKFHMCVACWVRFCRWISQE